MRTQHETPDQYEARKTAFLKMKTRRITNALRKEMKARQAKEDAYNAMTPAQRIEAMNIAHAEWLSGC